MYDRLRQVGFDSKFVRGSVLPDWWKDSLASVPSNRAIAETSIARLLGFKIAKLRKHSASLTFPSASTFRLKSNKGTKASEVRATVFVAQQVAKFVLESITSLPRSFPGLSARDVRQKILEENRDVNLKSLLDFCWDNVITVIHLDSKHLPAEKRIQGAAMFLDRSPVVVLGHSSDSPPWLAFHLAHEMGHFFCKHVKRGDKPLVDSEIDEIGGDQQEIEANEFATELLTGKKQLAFVTGRGLTACKIKDAALQYGAGNAIDPGTVALIYGNSTGRWGVAQNALKIMNLDHGGQQTIADALAEHIDTDEIPESTERFFSCLSASFA